MTLKKALTEFALWTMGTFLVVTIALVSYRTSLSDTLCLQRVEWNCSIMGSSSNPQHDCLQWTKIASK